MGLLGKKKLIQLNQIHSFSLHVFFLLLNEGKKTLIIVNFLQFYYRENYGFFWYDFAVILSVGLLIKWSKKEQMLNLMKLN